uniref:Peptidase_S8 domain-containing protein n=1 Tax=Trichobilharzia regenti TaxID=157069 RepID=A0AA85IU31_TRIRE|nr:unnamed protein product [Trichobilharzia regenti]
MDVLFSLLIFSLFGFCSASTTPSYIYELKIVEDEFIINYRQYFPLQSRHQFLTSLLNPLNINYSILDRWYPKFNEKEKISDFDVIKFFNLDKADTQNLTQYLSNVSYVKSITAQKQINRVLLNNYNHNEGLNSSHSIFGRNLNLFDNSQRNSAASRTLPLDYLKQPWKLLNAEYAWSRGLCGNGVRVGIFDTGLASPDHPHFLSSNIIERTDWTVEMSNKSNSKSDIIALDRHGHGTYVTGLISAQNPDLYCTNSEDSSSSSSTTTTTTVNEEQASATTTTSTTSCPPWGFAPKADLFIFRVFTDLQLSYTSWFLDAFNYAISRKLHVINLSIGGPDFLDKPFVDKVLELSANGILLVSAIGNDGPLFGTLNNPADQMDVLGVGGVDALGRVARFSSRGMTGWELPTGYGRVKPDIVTFSTGVISSGLDGKCRVLSGTSVASPIVTGVVILLINAALNHNSNLLAEHQRNTVYTTNSNTSENNTSQVEDVSGLSSSSSSLSFVPINPISIKQALIASADTLDSVRVFGTNSIKWLQETDQSSIFEQGAGLVNLQSALETVQRMKPQASLMPSYLDLTQCPYMWPYCSQPLYATMRPIVINVTILNSMHVIGRIHQRPVYHPFIKAEGYISLVVESYDHIRNQSMSTYLQLPIKANIIPVPDRSKRILFDQFHSIHYPSGFIPRDDLTRSKEPLDWLGDHIHTNYLDLYTHLRKRNYFIEVLTSSYDCFDASNYGTLLLIDPEEEFYPHEVKKLFIDVTQYSLSLIVFADWYNTSVMHSLRFFDTNTRRIWSPDTGGSNLPGLNDLLEPFGIELGDSVFAGNYAIGHRTVSYHSGTSIKRFPVQNISNITGRAALLKTHLVDIGSQFIQHDRQRRQDISENLGQSSSSLENDKILINSEPVLRLKPIINEDPTPSILGLWTPIADKSNAAGRLAVYGDSDCLSSTHLSSNCFWLLDALLQFSTSSQGRIPRTLIEQMFTPSTSEWFDPMLTTPYRIKDSHLNKYSNVIRSDWNALNDEVSSYSLPLEAYRPLQPCYIAPTASVIVDKTLPNESLLYRPQPLLFYPSEFYQPLKKAYSNQYYFQCLVYSILKGIVYLLGNFYSILKLVGSPVKRFFRKTSTMTSTTSPSTTVRTLETPSLFYNNNNNNKTRPSHQSGHHNSASNLPISVHK